MDLKILSVVLILALMILLTGAGLYKTFQKCNISGWKALIPIYNLALLLKIIKKPVWFVVFIIVPILSNLLVPYIYIQLLKKFDIKGFWKILLSNLFLFISLPVLGFSKKLIYSNPEAEEKYSFGKDIGNWAYSIAIAISLVVFIKCLNIFWFQNYRIPTRAMESNLLIGDHIFVNKFVIGPRLPQTPIALPFNHNTIPFLGVKSYLPSVQLPYIRIGGTPGIKRNDIVVFNFPEGDTVCLESPEISYYALIRDQAGQLNFMNPEISGSAAEALARQQLSGQFNIVTRPLDRIDNYVKRCVGLPRRYIGN